MTETFSNPESNLGAALDQLIEGPDASLSPGETLREVVRLIADHFGVDVCSIYLLEPDRGNLVLAATVGLRIESVGVVRMAIDEGLAGLVADQLRPVAVSNVRDHPRFKYFREAGEDGYQSFLGVPLADRGILQGVLVVQTATTREFDAPEIKALSHIANQIGPVVSAARDVDQFIAPTAEKLWALAHNLWWSWDNEAVSLFRDLDPVRWRALGQNPIRLLSEIPLLELERRAGELVLHSRINYTYRRFREYLRGEETWGVANAGMLHRHPVAYFSAEFGLHESMPIYSGGLGVLSGDHVKSASDLGVPLIGIGLFYRQGYFHQRLDNQGWQTEEYLKVDPAELPLEPALGLDGVPVTVSIETRTGVIHARAWRVAVGRCLLLLLDSDVDGNEPEDRELTARLYGGDRRIRIRQELLLGVGGVRALSALGITPGVYHLNEGHSAFAVLDAVRERMETEGFDFAAALRRVQRRIVFTTHTPVPAGHDRFTYQLISEHLDPLRISLGLSEGDFMALGRVSPGDIHEEFCMTVLALKMSARANAVSSLHGEVSRNMWRTLYPGDAEEEVPIGHITNGVHVRSWLAPQMLRLYGRYLGVDWHPQADDDDLWRGVSAIDDGELWETHLALKSRLLDFARRRSVEQAERRGADPEVLGRLSKVLNPDALTIGFARRFATYKRADLILGDLDLLQELVNDPKRPMQLVFAGKAHPLDEPGKRVLQTIAALTRDPRFRDRIVFIEDYDIEVGRHLVQGVDVWLNTPRRPMEASGTSGEKVILNGGLNLSVLDGWWAEAYDGSNGFGIGLGRVHVNTDEHDRRDGIALYQALRHEVIPLYYNRDRDGLPRGWIRRMKRAIRTLGWRFAANRMVMDYANECYLPAAGGRSSDMQRRG